MANRLAYLRSSGSRFTDRCGCMFSRDQDGKPFVSPCVRHRTVIVLSSTCEECGWSETGAPDNREEFHLCQDHYLLWSAA
jgi:hypothetical protein